MAFYHQFIYSSSKAICGGGCVNNFVIYAKYIRPMTSQIPPKVKAILSKLKNNKKVATNPKLGKIK